MNTSVPMILIQLRSNIGNTNPIFTCQIMKFIWNTLLLMKTAILHSIQASKKIPQEHAVEARIAFGTKYKID